jgi:hypothetical protein
MHSMRAINLSYPFKHVLLLAVIHARARASEHVCVLQCVSVLMLLLKLVSLQMSVQEYESSILSYISLSPSKRTDMLACVRPLNRMRTFVDLYILYRAI